MANICVIALIGLPAAGKTTFCKTLLRQVAEFNCAHLCYDEIFTYRPQSSDSAFKTERRKALQKLEAAIDEIRSGSDARDSVILCDDNNYYAGMRYEIYKICKQRQLSFGQFYFPIDLEEALIRNSARASNALPQAVLEKMHSRLEAPSLHKHWEANTFTIKNSMAHAEVLPFLRECLANPLKLNVKAEVIQIKSSVIHDIDLALRKRIAQLLRQAKGDVKATAEMLNQRRKSILSSLRSEAVSEEDLNMELIIERLQID